MKKFNYFDFMRGEEVIIREILEEKESPKENLTYFVLALHQTEECENQFNKSWFSC